MNQDYERVRSEAVTIVDNDGNHWARLACRGCLLKDRRKLRFPVWVLKGIGSGLCNGCREPHVEPIGRQTPNPNLHRSYVHRAQYEGERLWYSDDRD
jgi:hypothetical protein